MPTLSAPNVSTYRTTTPNEIVNVICTGQNDSMVVSWVGPGGISGQRTVRNTSAAGEEVGPFPNDTTVTFAAGSGTPSFTAPAYGEPLQALVSGAGNITAAELATTAGTTGQTVRLSDGADRGAILMWSTPDGASTETWCWWLWPQAAY